MKVVVLTTSYPRDASDVAGNFVASAVEACASWASRSTSSRPRRSRTSGSPTAAASRRTCAARRGSSRSCRRSSPRTRALRGVASRDADLVHAHWIPSAIAARATGKPYVLQVWGTDVELARRAPALVRPLLRGARTVIAASSVPRRRGAQARRASASRWCPTGVEIPEHVGEPADPPHVLYAGRLSEEKGILEFVEATEGLPRVIVGDGPLRDRVPEAVGFVPPARARRLLRARRGRLRPVAARGLRHDRPRGDGLRPAGGRDAGRRADRPERRRDVR